MYEDVCDRNEAVIRGASILRWRELLKDTKHQTRNDTLVNLYRDRVDRIPFPEYFKGTALMVEEKPSTQYGN